MANNLYDTVEASARSGFFLVFGSAVATIILAVGSIVAGRLLGPEQYGQYSLILVVPQLLFLFTDLGINQGIIKFATKLRLNGEADRIPSMIYCGLFLRTLTGVLMSVILYLFAESFAVLILNRADFYPYLRLMSTVILFQAIYSVAVSAFVSLDKSEYSALTSNIDAIVKVAFTVVLVLLGLDVTGALAGNIAGYVIAGICGIVVLRFALPRMQLSASLNTFKSDVQTLVHYGAPLYVTFLLTGFVPLFQNIVLANFTTDIDIGNFKAATNFAAIMAVLSFPITNALLSAFSRFDSAKEQKVKIFFKLANKYTSLIVFPVTILFVVFSSEIVQVVYGSTYQSAPLFLASTCLLYFLVGLGYLNLASFFNGLGETKTTLKIGLLTFLLIAFLSPIFTQAYGVLGLIGAFLIANTIGTSYGAYVARKKHNVTFDTPAVMRICVVSLVSAAPLIFLRFLELPALYSLIVGGSVYFVAYTTLIPLTRTVTGEELEKISETVQKISFLRLIGKIVLTYEIKILHAWSLLRRKKEPQSKL